MILLIILLILLMGVTAPVYPYNRAWGWNPFALIILVLLVLALYRYV